MKSITNASPGIRVINVTIGKDSDGKPVAGQVAIAPGETVDVDVINPEDPVFKGMVASKDLIVGAKGTKPETDADRAAREEGEAAARVALAREEGYRDGYTKGLDDGKKPAPKA